MMRLWEFNLSSAIRAVLFEKNKRIKYLCFVVLVFACLHWWINRWPCMTRIRFLRLGSVKFPLMTGVSELIYDAMCDWRHSLLTDEFLEEIQYAYRHVLSPEKIQCNTVKVAQVLWSNRNVCFICPPSGRAASKHLNRCLGLFLFSLLIL